MKNRTLQELQEQYKNCPESVSAYEVDGTIYHVHSKFIGDKNINDVMDKLAFEYALKTEKNSVKNFKKALARFDFLRYNKNIESSTALI